MKCFSLKGETFLFTPITNGYINDTFLVKRAKVPIYVLQRVNHGVFKDIDGLMSNINRALKKLDSDDYQKIELKLSGTSKPYFEDENGYWRLMTFIQNSTTHNTTTDLNTAFEAGRIIGKFHQLLETSSPSLFVDTIPDFHKLELRTQQFNNSKSGAEPNKLKNAKKAVEFVEEMVQRLQDLTSLKLPIRICHNDTKLNNILFSKATKKALCLIDLDTIMKGHFYYDFGDAIRTIINYAPEDETALEKITFEKALFSAFIDGIASNGNFLTKEEIASLSLGTVFMPFIHGLRALTDYLNNNIYYKVAYENQNLDRALSLFAFAEKAFNEIDFMERVTSEKLTPVTL